MSLSKSKMLSRPPLARIIRIHELLQQNKFPNCRKIADEIEVVPRTIARDIEFMKYQLNLPIEYNKSRHGYYYSEPVENFPAMNLNEKELFSLLVAQKSIAQYKGTPYQKPLETALNKILNCLDNEIYYYVKELDKAVNFRPFVPDIADEQKFNLIHNAIQKSIIIEFNYKKLAANKPMQRRLRPYCLICVENHWYLIGFDELRQGIRTFSLPRIIDIKLTDKQFKKPSDFNINEYLSGSLGIFKGTADYEVVIDLDRWGANFIQGKKLNETQKITPMPGGGARLTLRLNNIEEIERWILSMCPHAAAVKPRILVDKIAEDIKQMAKHYKIKSDSNLESPDYQDLPGLKNS